MRRVAPYLLLPNQVRQLALMMDQDLRTQDRQATNKIAQLNSIIDPNEHQFTASYGTQAQDPTSGNLELPLDVPEIGGESILSNEMVEVASIWEYEDERRVAQRKGKGRE